MRFQMLAPDDVDQYIMNGTGLLIDLREPAEYEKSHLRNAQNIPYRSENWFRWIGKRLDRKTDKKIILYCERGPTSFAAAKELAEEGIVVFVMVGGIKSYRGKMKEGY